MIIIKIGGSLIAPKNTEIFNEQFLLKISSLLKRLNTSCLLSHGAGNLGHGLVLKHGLNQESRKIWKEDTELGFYEYLKNVFPQFQRIEISTLLNGNINFRDLFGKNIIVGGDISEDLEVLSGDTSFAYFMKISPESIGYMFTDVDGVLDGNKEVIPILHIDSIDKVFFWKKKGDSKNSMLSKITELSKFLKGTKKVVWIVNGHNIQNIERIIHTGKGIGTKILF